MLSACVMWNCKCASDARMLGYIRLSSVGWGLFGSGCSKRPSSKAAASEGPEAVPSGYVEGLNDARTQLADFFSSLSERTVA
jgi:hypothetical protein